MSLSAAPRINPDDKGIGLATVIRLYQLKGTGKLLSASFDDLLDHDRAALGEDFLSVQEVTVNPSDRLTQPTPRNPDAAYIAAVALFRKPAANTWRAVKKLAAADSQFCHADEGPGHTPSTALFVLDDNRIELR